MVIQKMKELTPPGTILKMPASSYEILSWDLNRHGEECMTYLTGIRSRKRVPASEILQAHEALINSGQFTRIWFHNNLRSADANPGNFSVIGALFELLGEAKYQGVRSGIYQQI